MPAGWVVDRIGVRISLTVAVIWWSLFTMATGAARSVSHFMGARSMLVRGTWTIMTPDLHSYEVARSIDGGRTWHTSFIARVNRAK